MLCASTCIDRTVALLRLRLMSFQKSGDILIDSCVSIARQLWYLEDFPNATDPKIRLLRRSCGLFIHFWTPGVIEELRGSQSAFESRSFFYVAGLALIFVYSWVFQSEKSRAVLSVSSGNALALANTLLHSDAVAHPNA